VVVQPLNNAVKWLGGLLRADHKTEAAVDETVAKELEKVKLHLSDLREQKRNKADALGAARNFLAIKEKQNKIITGNSPSGNFIQSSLELVRAKAQLEIAQYENDRIAAEALAWDKFFSEEKNIPFGEELLSVWKGEAKLTSGQEKTTSKGTSSFQFTLHGVSATTLDLIYGSKPIIGNGLGFTASKTFSSGVDEINLATGQEPQLAGSTDNAFILNAFNLVRKAEKRFENFKNDPSPAIGFAFSSLEEANLRLGDSPAEADENSGVISLVSVADPEALAKAIVDARWEKLLSARSKVKAPILDSVSGNGFFLPAKTSIAPEGLFPQFGAAWTLQFNLSNIFMRSGKIKKFQQAQTALIETERNRDYTRTSLKIRRLSEESTELIKSIDRSYGSIERLLRQLEISSGAASFAAALEFRAEVSAYETLIRNLGRAQAELAKHLEILKNGNSEIAAGILSKLGVTRTDFKPGDTPNIAKKKGGARLAHQGSAQKIVSENTLSRRLQRERHPFIFEIFQEILFNLSAAPQIAVAGARLCGIKTDIFFTDESAVSPLKHISEMGEPLEITNRRGGTQMGSQIPMIYPEAVFNELPSEGIPQGYKGITHKLDRIGPVVVKTVNERGADTIAQRHVEAVGQTLKERTRQGYEPVPGVLIHQDHSRLPTVLGPLTEETAHPHGQKPVRMLREAIVDGQAETREFIHYVTETLNGDMNGVANIPGSEEAPVLSTGDLRAAVGEVSHAPITISGDTPVAAQISRLLITKSIWYLSVQLAYQTAVSGALGKKIPSSHELTAWSMTFRDLFKQYSPRIYGGKSRSFKDFGQVSDKEALVEFMNAVIERISKLSQSDPDFEEFSFMSSDQLKLFVQQTVYAYLWNGVFEGEVAYMKITRYVNATVQSKSTISSLDIDTQVFVSHGQGLTIIYDPDKAGENKPGYRTASDPKAASLGAGKRALMLVLDRNGGEVVQLGKDPYADVRVYSLRKNRELTADEIRKLWKPLDASLWAEETPQIKGKTPVEADRAHLPALLDQTHDQARNASDVSLDPSLPETWNPATTKHFNHLMRLKAVRHEEVKREIAQRNVAASGKKKDLKPRAKDLVLIGIENSHTHMEGWENSLRPFFPEMQIGTYNSNDALVDLRQGRLAGEFDDETIFVIDSRGGTTAPSVGIAAALQRLKEEGKIGEVFVITRDGENDLIRALWPAGAGEMTAETANIWVTGETFSLTDASALTSVTHQFITDLTDQLFESMLDAVDHERDFPKKPFGFKITRKDLAVIKAVNDDMVATGIPTVIGRDASGNPVNSKLADDLRAVGKELGKNAKEVGQSGLVMKAYVFLTTLIGKALFKTSAVVLIALLVKLGFSPNVILVAGTVVFSVGTLLDSLFYTFGTEIIVYARRYLRGEKGQVSAPIATRTVKISARHISPILDVFLGKLFSQSPKWFTIFRRSGDFLKQFLQTDFFDLGSGSILMHFMPNGTLGKQMREAAQEDKKTLVAWNDELAQQQQEAQTAAQIGFASGVRWKTHPKVFVFSYDPTVQGFWKTIVLYSGAEKVFKEIGTPDNPELVSWYIDTRIDALMNLVAAESVMIDMAVEASTWRVFWLKIKLWLIHRSQEFAMDHTTPSPVSSPVPIGQKVASWNSILFGKMEDFFKIKATTSEAIIQQVVEPEFAVSPGANVNIVEIVVPSQNGTSDKRTVVVPPFIAEGASVQTANHETIYRQDGHVEVTFADLKNFKFRIGTKKFSYWDGEVRVKSGARLLAAPVNVSATVLPVGIILGEGETEAQVRETFTNRFGAASERFKLIFSAPGADQASALTALHNENVRFILDSSSLSNSEAKFQLLTALAELDENDFNLLFVAISGLTENSLKHLSLSQKILVIEAIKSVLANPAPRQITKGIFGLTLAPEVVTGGPEQNNSSVPLARNIDQVIAQALIRGNLSEALSFSARQIAEHLNPANSLDGENRVGMETEDLLLQFGKQAHTRFALTDPSLNADLTAVENAAASGLQASMIIDLLVFLKDGQGVSIVNRMERLNAKTKGAINFTLLVRDASIKDAADLVAKYPEAAVFGNNILFAPNAQTTADIVLPKDQPTIILMPQQGLLTVASTKDGKTPLVTALDDSAETTAFFLEISAQLVALSGDISSISLPSGAKLQKIGGVYVYLPPVTPVDYQELLKVTEGARFAQASA